MDEILGLTNGTFVDAISGGVGTITRKATQAAENTAAVDEFAASTDEIEYLKRARAIEAETQARAEAVRSAMCDKINNLKAGRYPTLEKRIRSLEYSDEEMYKYIRYLERVQYLLKQ